METTLGQPGPSRADWDQVGILGWVRWPQEGPSPAVGTVLGFWGVFSDWLSPDLWEDELEVQSRSLAAQESQCLCERDADEIFTSEEHWEAPRECSGSS